MHTALLTDPQVPFKTGLPAHYPVYSAYPDKWQMSSHVCPNMNCTVALRTAGKQMWSLSLFLTPLCHRPA